MTLAEFIERHRDEVRSSGEVSTEKIEQAARRLGAPFPREFFNYLRTYGSLECRYREFFGLGVPVGSPRDLVSRTLDLRSEGLPDDYVVLEDLDDMHFAVCSREGIVFEWAPSHGDAMLEQVADSLEGYLIEAMRSTFD